MKTLKLVAAVIFFTSTTGVIAQDKLNDSPKDINIEEIAINKEGVQLEKIKDQLNLTPEQKAQIKEIRAKRISEKIELKTKLKDIRVAERLEISTVLTEEQRTIVKGKNHERSKHKKAGHKEKNKAVLK